MARTKQERKERVPFGVARKKMNLDADTMDRLKRAGKVARWFNDTKDRLPRALAGGYEFVEMPDVKVGDAKELQETDRRIKKLVGRERDNSPIYAYLMAIPKRYHEADQKAKERINKLADDAIRAGQPQGLDNHGIDPSKGGATVGNISYKP